MEQPTITNICRICFTEDGEMKSVFVKHEGPENIPAQLAQMIMAYASVEISLGDGLPEQICISCAIKVKDTFVFKQVCELSDSLLRQRLRNLYNLRKEDTMHESKIRPDSMEVIIKREIDSESEDELDEPADKLKLKEKENSPSKYPLNLHKDVPVIESEIQTNSELVEIVVKPEFNINTIAALESSDQSDLENSNDGLINTEEESGSDNRSNRSEHTCKVCKKHFKIERFLRTHICDKIEGTDATKIERTKINPNVFVSEKNIVLMLENDSDGNQIQKYRCKLCQIILLEKDALMAHLSSHAGANCDDKDDKIHECHICSRKFLKPFFLRRHIKMYHLDEKPHVCDICNKGFYKKSILEDHLKTHNQEKSFTCPICGTGFKQVRNLGAHMKRHDGVKAHLCGTCGTRFATKAELKQHNQTVHNPPRESPFECVICHITFNNSYSLTKHKRQVHTGEKPHHCDICEMSFAVKDVLDRHKRTHTGEKPYVCKFCSKGFAQSNALKCHLRNHTGEKPFICQVCNKAFSQSNSLRCHIRIHTGEKPYVCNICEKGFHQSSGLRNHTKVHTGEQKQQTQLE